MDKIKLGIIGYGNMGSSHCRSIMSGLCPEVELAAVADISPERLEAAQRELPESTAKFDSAQKLLDSGTVNAVLVAVPHYDHPTYAVECFNRGLHVMIEKPAGVYTKQVRLMNEAAAKTNVAFGLMFNQRTNHIYRKMREIVQSGKYGEIRRTNWIVTDWFRTQSYYDSGSWRATWSGEGGGVLLNQCPHQLDLWQWICGMPKSVSTRMYFGKWHDIEVEDDVSTFVEYPNGATGVFITSTGDGCGTNRFEILLDRARIISENGSTLKVWELEHSISEFIKSSEEGFAHLAATPLEIETDGKNEQHVGVLNAFAGNILHGAPLIAGGEEGINGLTISNAMHLSAWLGKKIDLPLDEDVYYDELMKRVATSRRKADVKSVVADLTGTY